MLFLPQQPSTLALMHWQKLCEKVHKIWYYQSCIQLLAIVLCKVSSLVATPGKKLVFAGTALGDGEGVPKLWIFIFYSGKVPQLCVQYLPGYSGLSSCIIMGDFNAGMEIIENYMSWNESSMMIKYSNIPLSLKCHGMVINWPLNNTSIWEITSINQWTHSSRCLGLSDHWERRTDGWTDRQVFPPILNLVRWGTNNIAGAHTCTLTNLLVLQVQGITLGD